MTRPLDYYTPNGGDRPTPVEPVDASAAAIPVEFDAELTRTADHPAARAVEAELRRHGIAFFRAEGAGRTNRGVELHVRSADHTRASQLAASVFARRKRLDTISPRPKPPRDDTLTTGGDGVDGFPGIP